MASKPIISLCLVVDRSNNKVIFAESSSNFVDILLSFLTLPLGTVLRLTSKQPLGSIHKLFVRNDACSFLTYPLGFVANKLGGRSGIRCLDNLYNSIEALGSSNFFRIRGQKDTLVSPNLPPYFKLEKQLIVFDEDIDVPRHYLYQNKRFSITDPKYCPNDGYGTGGIFRNSMYMITDDLVLNPLSYSKVVLDYFKEAGSEILAKNIEIGVDEALALLQASIISEKVLTDVLMHNKLEGKHTRRGY